MSNKENLNKISIIISTLNQNLSNRNLYDYIFDKFECIISKDFKIKKITDKEIVAKDKVSNDIFIINFEPNIENFSKITTSYTCFDNNHVETKEITFDNEKIIIEENESTIYTYSTTKSISSIQKSINKKEYQNNELIYSYHFESETSVNLTKKHDGTTIEEMYIMPNKNAVKSISILGEANYFGTKGIRYYITKYCDEPKFNTRNQKDSTYISGFESTTEKEYQDFIQSWKKTYKTINKQKKLG